MLGDGRWEMGDTRGCSGVLLVCAGSESVAAPGAGQVYIKQHTLDKRRSQSGLYDVAETVLCCANDTS